jgi:hypothetical protein
LLSDIVDFVTPRLRSGLRPPLRPSVTKSTRSDKITRDPPAAWQNHADLWFPVFLIRLEVILQLDLASFCQIARHFVTLVFARILTKCGSQTVSWTVPIKNYHSELDGDTYGETVILDTVSALIIFFDNHDCIYQPDGPRTYLTTSRNYPGATHQVATRPNSSRYQ